MGVRTTWEHVYTVLYIRERVHERPSLLLPIHKHIYFKRIWRMRQRGNWPWYFVVLKSKSTVYLLTTFLKRLQILKQEWQYKPSWDQANRRQKLGLVWRIRKKISQIFKDYFYLPFFLLIILWYPRTFHRLTFYRRTFWGRTFRDRTFCSSTPSPNRLAHRG